MIVFLALMIAIYYDNPPLPNKDYIQTLEEEIWLKNYYKPLERAIPPQAMLDNSLISQINRGENLDIKVLSELN